MLPERLREMLWAVTTTFTLLMLVASGLSGPSVRLPGWLFTTLLTACWALISTSVLEGLVVLLRRRGLAKRHRGESPARQDIAR